MSDSASHNKEKLAKFFILGSIGWKQLWLPSAWPKSLGFASNEQVLVVRW